MRLERSDATTRTLTRRTCTLHATEQQPQMTATRIRNAAVCDMPAIFLGCCALLLLCAMSLSSASPFALPSEPGLLMDPPLVLYSSDGRNISTSWSAGPSDAEQPSIRIAMFGCSNPSAVGGGCWRDRPTILRDLWLTHVRDKPILGRYRVEIVEALMSITPSYNRTQLERGFANILAQGPIDFMVLPLGNTIWPETFGAYLDANRIVSIALSPLTSQFVCDPVAWVNQSSCLAANTRRFNYANSILNIGTRYFESFVGILRVEGVRTVAILRTRSAFYDEVAAGARASALAIGIKVVFDLGINGIGGVVIVEPSVLDGAVDALIATAPDVDVLVLVSWSCVPFIQRFKARNWLPKGIGALRCVDTGDTIAQLGDDLRWITGPGQWSEEISTPDYSESLDTQPWALFPSTINGVKTELSSAMQFGNAYRLAYNYSADSLPSYADASYLACLTALEAAMTLANSTSMGLVQRALNGLFQPSFSGILSFNSFGINSQKSFVTLQRDSTNRLQLIDPFVVATSRFVYPMPAWNERVYRNTMLESTVERVFIALMLACMLVTSGLCVYLYRHRRRQMLHAAGVVFYSLIGFGCMLAFASILTWPVDNDWHTCKSRLWLWTAGFYFVCSPILAQSFRIARIQARAQLMQKTRMNQRVTLILAALITLPQTIINIVWSAHGGLRPELVVPDPIRPSLSFTSCVVSSSEGQACLVATFVCMFLALAIVCLLAWKIRRVESTFNDAVPLSMSMYLFLLVSVILLVLHYSLNQSTRSSQLLLFAVRSGAVLLVYQTSIMLLYFRRILHKNKSVASENVFDVKRSTPLRPLSYQRPFTQTQGDGRLSAIMPFAHQQTSRAQDDRIRRPQHVLLHPEDTTVAGTPLTATDIDASLAPVRLSTLNLGAGCAHLGLTSHSSQPPDPAQLEVLPPAENSEEVVDEWSQSLLVLSTPRFHLPDRSEYAQWTQAQLVALVDEASESITDLQNKIEEERNKRELRAKLKRQTIVTQRKLAQPASSSALSSMRLQPLQPQLPLSSPAPTPAAHPFMAESHSPVFQLRQLTAAHTNGNGSGAGSKGGVAGAAGGSSDESGYNNSSPNSSPPLTLAAVVTPLAPPSARRPSPPPAAPGPARRPADDSDDENPLSVLDDRDSEGEATEQP